MSQNRGPRRSAQGASASSTRSSGDVRHLPLVDCPFCGKRVIRLQSKQPATCGLYFFKCEDNVQGDPTSCRFYKWEYDYRNLTQTIWQMDRESYLEQENILRDIKAGRAKPCHLPFEFLKIITKNFSADLELGRGGYGVVYKGVLKSGEIVAVKRLDAELRILDKQYESEVHLLKLKHLNIVRILGHCSEERVEVFKHEGRKCCAYKLERLICLEYMPNGSLDRHITDASSGLTWDQRHKIIMGICFGLHFLHEENPTNTPIIHLDLKPANILLTNEMDPKITDFGLSRLFGSKIYTKNNIGTRGYMAKEFIDRGKITKMSDIFSFGVIVLEVITGHRDYPWSNDTTVHQNYVEIEVQKWRERMMKDLSSTFVEKNCLQIKNCIQIGLKCVNTDEMKRPTTMEIIESLNRSLNTCIVGSIPAVEGLSHGLYESPFANVGPSCSFAVQNYQELFYYKLKRRKLSPESSSF